MRLAQIKLAPDNFFWFLGEVIVLNQSNPVSDLIDIDAFTFEEQKIINSSAKNREIVIFNREGLRVKSLKEISIINAELSVSIDDTEDDDTDQFPEMIAVTIDDKEETDVLDKFLQDEGLKEEANIILNKNGNTVRKTIRNLANTEEAFGLLNLMFISELNNRNRSGVIKLLETKIKEFENGRTRS